MHFAIGEFLVFYLVHLRRSRVLRYVMSSVCTRFSRAPISETTLGFIKKSNLDHLRHSKEMFEVDRPYASKQTKHLKYD